jgi:ParD-like antitoxin of type II bacterial toxin-antitoxin system
MIQEEHTVKKASIPTRVAADLATSAASVAPTENRTVTEQINYWARIGMQVERSGSLATRRLLAVAVGDVQFATLNSAERTTAHALIDAQIAMRLAQQRFGLDSRAAGQTTVSLDDDGNLIEIAPNGDRRRL